MARAALFLDRDGTVIRHVHYLCDPAEVELLPGARAALARARDLGYLLFLHTNQSGVGRGMYKMEQAEACHRRMLELLTLGDGIFTEICMAPEAPHQPQVYRKPSPRFAQEMAQKHHLDLPRCWMVGDNAVDVETAFATGMRAAAVVGGYLTEKELAAWRAAGKAVTAADSLLAFVETLGKE